MDVGEFFLKFINEKWSDVDSYDLAYFKNTYNINYNITQFYLKRAVYDGRLCCIKIKNKTYYCKRKWYDSFKRFEILKFVKVS